MHDFNRSQKWIGQLLAVACLSIATKVEETKMPQLKEFQVEEPKFVFEAKSIHKMELLVLSTLQWKMHAFSRKVLNKENNFQRGGLMNGVNDRPFEMELGAGCILGVYQFGEE
ncbi:hypothetical protein K1719_018337 [Acacia pycnantha]|nr:hypothetical protein K1719_018337 [Acacia pycnantha]